MDRQRPSTREEQALEAMDADRPRAHVAEDLLGFEPLGRAIARVIASAPASSGLVLHVQGEWGSGKSTMLNFVREFVSGASAQGLSSTKTIDFNPWWFDNRDHLAQLFLGDLHRVLARESRELRTAGRLIAKYADKLAPYVAGSLSVFFSVPQLASALSSGLKVFFKSLDKKAGSLPELKKEIGRHLERAQERIVVFVDDIDRLTPPEMSDVFRVVKAVADFPNVVYVLAFDAEVVGRAMAAVHHVDGRGYLEKIIQASFYLPSVTPDRMRTLFTQRVERIVGEAVGSSEEAYWNDISTAASALIRKPRDLAHVTNALIATYPAVRHEVDRFDFVGIETLRITAPQAYEGIRRDGGRWATNADAAPVSDRSSDESSLAWLANVAAGQRHAVANLIRILFAPVAPEKWTASRARGVNSRWLPVYFQYRPIDDELGQQDARALAQMSSANALVGELTRLEDRRRLDGRSKADDFVEWALHARLSEESAITVVGALFRWGPVAHSMDIVRRDLGLIPPRVEAHEDRRFEIFGAVRHALAQVSAANKRAAIEEGLEIGMMGPGLEMYGVFIYRLHDPSSFEVDYMKIRPDDLASFSRLLARNISRAADEGSLIRSEDLVAILRAWELVAENDLRRWLKSAFHDDDALVPILACFVGAEAEVPASANARRPYLPQPWTLGELEHWLEAAVDFDALEARVEERLKRAGGLNFAFGAAADHVRRQFPGQLARARGASAAS